MAGLWKHFKDGGWGMYPIVFWSILTIGIIIERALYLYGSGDQQGRVPRDDAEVHPRG